MLSKRYPAILTPYPAPDIQPLVIPPRLDPSCVLALLPLRDSKWHDYSGKGNHGVITSAQFDADFSTYPGLYFDGSNDYVTIPDSSSLDLAQAMTLETVFRPFGAQNQYAMLMCKGDGDAVYSFYVAYDSTGKKLSVIIYTYSFRLLTTPLEYLSGLIYLAATYDGAVLTLYINGIKISDGPLNDDLIDSGNLGIGSDPYGPNRYLFNGLIFFTFIHNRVFSAREIALNSKQFLLS